MAEDADVAGRRLREPGRAVDQRGLAGAVRAEQLCGQIAFINDGEIVATGTSQDLAGQFGVSSLEDAYLELVGRKELSRAHIGADAA